MIFGDIHENTLWAKGEPGAGSSGRIMYNTATKNIGFYFGHTMKWDDEGDDHLLKGSNDDLKNT